MSLHSYLLFVVASFVLVLVPGPDMLYMLGRCIAQGRRAGALAALGFNLGGYVHLLAAVLGLSAILQTSAVAFTVVKWLGAAYLMYLGFSALISRQKPLIIDDSLSNDGNSKTILWQAFVSDVLNPKVAMFFLALLPQFVDVTAQHPKLQILLLGVTVNVIALPTNLLLVYASAYLTKSLRQNQRLSRWLRKGMAALLVYLGFRAVME
ncbi:MAG TPA: LysE family translocator [Steroidobacteraceae bacterium]|nr:LysE family translocator [Steroidobacteraceae bacterium]